MVGGRAGAAPSAGALGIGPVTARPFGLPSNACPGVLALHAGIYLPIYISFSCLTLSLYHLEVGWSLLSLCVVSLANSVCVCLRTSFTIVVSCLVFRLIAL